MVSLTSGRIRVRPSNRSPSIAAARAASWTSAVAELPRGRATSPPSTTSGATYSRRTGSFATARAVAAEAESRSASRPASSARIACTWTLASVMASAMDASSAARFFNGSTRSMRTPGSTAAITSPGQPPPLPTSARRSTDTASRMMRYSSRDSAYWRRTSSPGGTEVTRTLGAASATRAACSCSRRIQRAGSANAGNKAGRSAQERVASLP